MSTLHFWLLVAVVAGLATWRVAVVRRRAADRAARREQANAAALAMARAAVSGRKTTASGPAASAPGAAAADERASARAKAERVIAAEAARRKAAIKKAENAAHAEAERVAEARKAAEALAATIVLPPRPPQPAARPAPAPHSDAAARAMEATTPMLPPVPRPAAPAPAPTPKSADQVLVMLVDDSKMVRVKSGRLLAAQGFQVVTAVDGLDALRQIEDCSPDIVVTDVDMPGLDGFGLTAALRGDARTRHLPIVMITSAEDRHREAAHAAGVGLVLGKPYDEDALIAHIRSHAAVGTARGAQAPAFA